MGLFDIKPKEEKLSEDGAFFKKLWNERPHISEVSGAELAYNFNPSMYFVFSHVHSKAACPALRHHPKNIVFMTMREHQQWEHERHTLIDKETGKPFAKWRFVFDLFEELKPMCDESHKSKM